MQVSNPAEAHQTFTGSSADEDDRFMVQSMHDDIAVDSDSEDVCNESYEVL